MKMKEKAENDVSTKEIYEKKRLEEEKIVHYQKLLKAINDELDAEREAFRKNKENLDKLAITEQVEEQVELEDGMKSLQEQFEEDLKQPEQLMNKRHEYEVSLREMIESAKINQADLLKRIRQANEKFTKIKARNTDLRGKNKILNDQLKTALQEEYGYFMAKLVSQEVIDKLEETIIEKRAFLNKRLTDIKALEEAIENLRTLYRTTIESYRKQIEFLKGNWVKESQRSVINQWKIIHLQKQHENWVKTEEANIQEIIQKIDQVEKRRIEVVEESITCDEEIIKHEEKIEELCEELKEEEEIFSKVEQDVTDKLKVIEDKYIAHFERAKEKEEELEMFIPKVKVIEDEYEENAKEYETLKYHVSAQNREQESLKYGIGLMKKETSKYKNDREHLKNLLKKGRSEELLRMKKRLSIIYLSERNIYETEQKLRLLILENYRIRKALKLLREDIAYFQKEGENHIASAEKMEVEVDELKALYAKMWTETLKEIKKFREENKITLEEIVKLVKMLYKREEKLKVICGWLRRNVDNLEYIIDYKESNTNIGETEKTEKKKKATINKTMSKGTIIPTSLQ
ncbi:coiled-coil domain-containing protein 175 [Dromiciops gliroides]|uniref:coiled-coil domain-containing protein 175 n=1 Tax=Dromiciops gliroides TaxID=33562 RepID=UPI001CC4A16A|nr:coiled-coil domain-containing protein 175 [Dromiciops gliroides]